MNFPQTTFIHLSLLPAILTHGRCTLLHPLTAVWPSISTPSPLSVSGPSQRRVVLISDDNRLIASGATTLPPANTAPKRDRGSEIGGDVTDWPTVPIQWCTKICFSSLLCGCRQKSEVQCNSDTSYTVFYVYHFYFILASSNMTQKACCEYGHSLLQCTLCSVCIFPEKIWIGRKKKLPGNNHSFEGT